MVRMRVANPRTKQTFNQSTVSKAHVGLALCWALRIETRGRMLSSGLKCYVFMYAWTISKRGFQNVAVTQMACGEVGYHLGRESDSLVPESHLCSGTLAL